MEMAVRARAARECLQSQPNRSEDDTQASDRSRPPDNTNGTNAEGQTHDNEAETKATKPSPWRRIASKLHQSSKAEPDVRLAIMVTTSIEVVIEPASQLPGAVIPLVWATVSSGDALSPPLDQPLLPPHQAFLASSQRPPSPPPPSRPLPPLLPSTPEVDDTLAKIIREAQPNCK